MNEYKYLEIIERPLDSAQRNVCFTTENAVIAAGAGSGKTQVLATRFAWLVISKGLKASEVLTLTFTDKAASEMYQRIYATLKYFADYKVKTDEDLLEFFKKKRRNPSPTAEQIILFREGEKDLTEDKKQRAREALLDFKNAHIQTLDSYCGSVVRQCANRYGISPDFSVGSGDGVRNIKDKSFKFILKHINESCIQEFASPGKIQDFAENHFANLIIKCTSLSTADGFFESRFENLKSEVANLWNELFVENLEKSLQSKILVAQNELFNHKDKDKKNRVLWVTHAKDVLELGSELSDKLSSIKSEDFEKEREKILSQIDLLSDFFEKLSAVCSETNSLSSVKKLLKIISDISSTSFRFIKYFVRKYTEHLSLVRLLDEFLSEINSQKRSTGALSFNDVTELAVKVLLENEDIRNNEKNSYKKIMIDEFQDNNSKNRDLLYLLSLKKGEFESNGKCGGNCVITVDPENPDSLHDQIAHKRDEDKLFFVGDEKQSIYKFRNADVSVFNNLTKENKKVFMSFNYRSSPELINAFNIFFANDNGIFVPPVEQTKNDFEAHYSQNAQKNGMEQLPKLTAENVPIHVCLINEKLLEKDKDEENPPEFISKDQQIAYFTAKKIRQLAEKEFEGLPESEWKWENFAILDRTRTYRDDITKYLNLFNIPYQVDVFKNIFEEGVINDIYNFLRLCVYPSDINAFAAYLCSPLAGLSENAMEIVLSYLNDIKFRGFEEEPFVFDPLNQDFDKEIQVSISKIDFEKFIQARNFYAEYRSNVLQQELTKTLSDLWHKKGYKYETMLTKQSKLCAEHFDMLFELARTSEKEEKSVSWFIDELDNLKSAFAVASDSDIDAGNVSYPLERSHAVQIMTIHKSKGLQFDHVFVFGCVNYSGRPDVDEFYFDEKVGVVPKNEEKTYNLFGAMKKDLESEKNLAEFRRLIYVAITRAIKSVYILGRTGNSGYVSFRLIWNMVVSAYPKILEQEDFALDNPVFNPECAFDFQEILPVTYAQLPKTKSNSDEIRQNLIEKVRANIQKENFVDSTCHGIERKTPSSLHKTWNDGQGAFCKEEKSNSDAKDFYAELSAILKKYNPTDNSSEEIETEETKFNDENNSQLVSDIFKETDFGTLVHDYLCKMALGIDIETYEPVPAKRYFKNLKEADRKKIVFYCRQMCCKFAETEIFKGYSDAVKSGRFAKPEYEFKYFDGSALFRGSMDLIFENQDGSYTLVDYKTDRNICPQNHFAQLNCYATAATDIVPHPGKINCCLHYLRFNETVWV